MSVSEKKNEVNKASYEENLAYHAQVREQERKDLIPKKLIQEIKGRQLNNLQQEHARLVTAGFAFSDKEWSQLAYNPWFDIEIGLELRVRRAQLVELTDSLSQQGYSVFMHGQESTLTGLVYFLKQLNKIFHPELDDRQFHPLRSLDSGLNQVNLEDVMGVNDHQYAASLLSVDAYPSRARSESALDFAQTNINVTINCVTRYRTVEGILRPYIPNEAARARMTKKLCELIERYGQMVELGSLFAICVPPELSEATDVKQRVLYRSHALGALCKCFPADREVEVLQSLNANKLPKEGCQSRYLGGAKLLNRLLGSSYCTVIPQYRLFTPKLQPENKIKIFCSAPWKKQDKAALKRGLEGIAKEIWDLSLMDDSQIPSLSDVEESEHRQAMHNLSMREITSAVIESF